MAKLRTITASKEWISLEDAIKELSYALKEEITETDLWNLVKDNKLTLSVWNNQNLIRYGRSCNVLDIFTDSEIDQLLLANLSKYRNIPEACYPLIEKKLGCSALGRIHDGFWLNLCEDEDLELSQSIFDLKIIANTIFSHFVEIQAIPALQTDYDRLEDLNLFSLLPEDEQIRRVNQRLSNLPAAFIPPLSQAGTRNNSSSGSTKQTQPALKYAHPSTFDMIFFSENDQIIAIDKAASQKITVSREGLSASVGEKYVYPVILPYVVRTKNLQTFLNTILPEEKNTSTPDFSSENSSAPEWTYRYPEKTNDVNGAISRVLEKAYKNGLKDPLDMSQILPIINELGELGRCERKKKFIYFHTEKDSSQQFSRTVDSLRTTIKGLIILKKP